MLWMGEKIGIHCVGKGADEDTGPQDKRADYVSRAKYTDRDKHFYRRSYFVYHRLVGNETF